MKESKSKNLHKTEKEEIETVKKEMDEYEKKGGQKNKRCAKLIKESLGDLLKDLEDPEYFNKITDAALEHCKKRERDEKSKS